MNFPERIVGFALLGSVGACDASIGRDTCLGDRTECRPITFDFYQALELTGPSIESMPAASNGALSITWRLNPCGGEICYPLLALGPEQSTWLLFGRSKGKERQSGLSVRRYALDGALLHTAEINDGEFTLAGFVPPASNAAGQLFTNVHWLEGGYNAHRAEVVRVDIEGEVTRTEVPWATFGSQGVAPYGVVPGDDGFDVFESAPNTQALRAYRGEGELAWQQTQLVGPPGNIVVEAVRTENGYALTGSLYIAGDYSSPSVLFTDDAGNAIQGFAFEGLGAPELRATADDQIAVASVVARQPGYGPEGGDIVVFWLDSMGVMSGHKLLRSDYQALTLHAFASDPAGNLFLSTQIGPRDALMGLLCRMQVDGDARCFESETDMTFGSLLALDRDTLYAVSNETHELLRVELPE